MHLVEVYVVGAQALKAGLCRAEDVVARQPGVILLVAHGEADLGGHEYVIAVGSEGFAQDLFGQAVGVDVGGVDQVDAGVAGKADLAAGPLDVDVADRARPRRPAEAHRAERYGRDAQPRVS